MTKSKEIQELQKDKLRALKCKNLKEAANICNYLGVLLATKGKLSEAVIEHQQELKLCEELEDSLGIAIANRRLGECFSELELFSTALNHLKQYLKIAIIQKNNVEIQRAQTTLGRTYFLHFSADNKANKSSLSKAEHNFTIALDLSEKLKSKLKNFDYAEMRCRALLNMALVYDHKNDESKCLQFLNEAYDLAQKHKLKEDVNRCQLSIANFYQKLKNFEKAKIYFEEGIKSAKQLKNKINLCETLISKAIVLIYLNDLEGAKHLFKKAYYTRSPIKEDVKKARNYYKQVRLIITKLQQINESNDDCCLLYDQIADCFVELNCFSLAIDYYKKELETAKKLVKNQSDIAVIYISLGQTFLDNDQFDEALDCFYKELDCRQGMIEETIKTLLKIIEIKVLLERDDQEIISEYEYALNKCTSQKLKTLVLKEYTSYLKDLNNFKDKYNQINKLLLELNQSDEDEETSEDIKGDDEIFIENSLSESDVSELTDDSDVDEVNEETFIGHVLRTREPIKKTNFKMNEKGETPLHRACIENKFNLVQKLVQKGHPVNPRDNAGWLPIHEAANHGYANITEYLIKHGANLNDRGGSLCNGTTPLHDACTNGHMDVIRILIKNGANVTSLDDDCNTPLDCFESYHERVEQMTDLEETDYQMLLRELKEAMKSSGFDFNHHFLKKSQSKNLERRLITNNQHNYQDSSNISQKNLDDNEDEAVAARREYQNAISHLRRHHDLPNHIHGIKPKINSLLNEEENVVENWLEEDIKLNDNRKRPYYDLYEMKSFSSKKSCNITKKLKPQLKSNKDINCPDNICKKDKKLDEIENEKLSKENLNFSPLLTDPVYENSYLPLEIKEPSLHKDSNLTILSPSSTSTSTSPISDSKEKLLINVHIDNKIFLITVPNRRTLVSWVADQTILRYYQMKQLKPVISLTTKEGALLSLNDYVVDVAIDNQIYAIIDSWDLEPLFKRYKEQCKINSVSPLDDLIFELKAAENSFCLKLTNVFLPSSQYKALINSLKHQTNLKLLDFSFSNIILLDLENELLQSLSNFKKLEKLNLKGTGLDKNKLIFLSKLKLSLERLNLSYNLFDESCLTHLVYLCSNIANLNKINLKYNNFTNCSSISSFLINSIKKVNSNQIEIVVES